MGEAYLDALIANLENPTNSTSIESEVEGIPALIPAGQEHDPGPGMGVQLQQEGGTIQQPEHRGEVAVRSPVHRSPLLSKYISSSSARRRIEKVTHCNYCGADHDRRSLGLHLNQSERCLTLYSRRLHVKSVEAVLCIIFDCLFCEDRVHKLFLHLESKEECRNQYLTKFNVDNSRAAVDKVIKLKRSGYKSRRSLSRAVENENAKKRKRDELKNEPEETFLNSHLNKNLFSNFRTCIACLCNLTNAEEVTINSDCIRSGAQNLENKDHLKRFGKLFICKHCNSDRGEIHEPGLQGVVTQSVRNGNKYVFIPILKDPVEEGSDEDEQIVEVEVENSKNVALMFPCSVESLKSVQVADNARSLSSPEVQLLLYRSNPFHNKTAGLLYQHQLLKYKRAKESGELFSGKILDNQTKTLTGLKLCSQENRIVGSNGWRRSQGTELSWKRKQLGEVCLRISVKFPFDDPQTLATHLVQRGHLVTTTLEGGETGELDRSYFVHTGHDTSTPCFPDCPKISLTEYLNQEGVHLIPDMATYVSSVDQLINSYIANVIKSPSHHFQADNFHLNISFDKEGQVIMEGLIWPKCFRDYNLVPYDVTISEEQKEEMKGRVLDDLRRHTSSSSNIRIIKSQFNLSQTEAYSLSKLVEKHQVHLCKEDDCDRCKNAPLPSLEFKFKYFPESPENLPSGKRFLCVLKGMFLSLSIEDIKSKATIEWLREVWDEVEISELVDDTLWRINLETEDFYFKLDNQLRSLLERYEDDPIAAIYQYCLGLGEIDEINEVLMKRLNLLDSYTDPYIPFYLKAANSSIKIEAVTASSSSLNWLIDHPDYLSCHEAHLNGHVRIHLAEAFSLIDSKKLRTRSSNISEFVFTGSSGSVLLKKVKQQNEHCFQSEGDSSYYEIQQSAVTRYCQRINGKDLLLSEVVCFYEFAGKDQSAIKYEIFKDRMEKIPSSEIASVVGEEKLPELILCQNKDVLQIRRKPKILMYKTHPEDTYDHKFGQVLLFSVVDKFEDLTPAAVEEIYDLSDETSGENVLVVNRRRLYKRLLQDF